MAELMLALDVDSFYTADYVLETLSDCRHVKVNHRLMFDQRFDGFYKKQRYLGRDFFFDLKLADTPDTVAAVTRMICSQYEPTFLSVREAVHAAVDAADSYRTKIAYVPHLSSDSAATQAAVNTRGVPALVCAPDLIKDNRLLNPDVIILVPGIRMFGAQADDHKTSVLLEGMLSGADYAICGRPILRAADRKAAWDAYQLAVK